MHWLHSKLLSDFLIQFVLAVFSKLDLMVRWLTSTFHNYVIYIPGDCKQLSRVYSLSVRCFNNDLVGGIERWDVRFAEGQRAESTGLGIWRMKILVWMFYRTASIVYYLWIGKFSYSWWHSLWLSFIFTLPTLMRQKNIPFQNESRYTALV